MSAKDAIKAMLDLDNTGKPRSLYIDRLVAMSDEELSDECKSKIWLSGYASNNARSDYHWQCDATYDECKRRNRVNIYEAAHKHVSKGAQ